MSFIERHATVIKRVLDYVHYDYRHWTRPVMYARCDAMLKELHPEKLNVLEISAGQHWREYGFGQFTEANYPDFDICSQVMEDRFDLIIADQVFEHLLWPYRAAKNVLTMLKPGGYFLVTTPFLIRIHDVPHDCTRWTETGLKYFLNECGFPMETIRTDSWGNRSCVIANFTKWARRGWFGSLRNEPQFPVAIWALAQSPFASDQH
ncbi:MAG: class I SAM-dependent methyltransferase [Gammaproteobacteria bacterium]|nr:methyltransferase domain-containing protein [Rhodocyclaceae bacterium]MBU3910153.1 class I SAM-dependent methyltransferase [Gammaproteobacteria bacterium]MBU3989687.1 class I SAM-dependent methyltransferase [Gammaproteobacteria bacterium]MBU4006160.1 class I SAM-dependent methyltransferase [Gammaproteobacteria bacterium]MBU4022615.1 class I SAM-dependent methyltransferase [Gammaproteobacteria bacterium]